MSVHRISPFLSASLSTSAVNITTLCRALQATHVQAEFQRLAGVAVVEGNTNEMLNGIWVHLALVAEWAEVLGIPDEVVNGLLAIDLANRVSWNERQKMCIYRSTLSFSSLLSQKPCPHTVRRS